MKWLWKVSSGSTSRADRALFEAAELGEGTWESGPRQSLSRSLIQKLIGEGKVQANGRPIKASSRLTPGTLVSIEFSEPRPLELIPEERDLEILFQDEHLLVLNKPPGLTVHPSSTQRTGTLVHALLHHIKDLSGIGGTLRPGIVHRIDKDTSGALVITKSDVAHRKLIEVFSKHEIRRKYWALCYGSPIMHKGLRTIESLIGRNPNNRKLMSMKVTQGRKAVTHFRKLEEFRIQGKPAFASFLELTLETGRTHQIRVHLTGIGHSILGDPMYGKPTSNQPKWLALPIEIRKAVEALPGQALHARQLGFKHPITGVELDFEAEAPSSFNSLLDLLRTYPLSVTRE